MKLYTWPLIFLLACAVPPPLLAGSGSVANGLINFTISLRFPPTPAGVQLVQDHVTTASALLWDATDGQLSIGTVTLTATSVDEDLADVWMIDAGGRAGSPILCEDGTTCLDDAGSHLTLFLGDPGAGFVLAHELGHLALGLADEYNEQNRFGNCWGYGRCIEVANLTEQNQCLMQQAGGFTWSEFCTAGSHDLVLGQGLPCAPGDPCGGVNCDLYSPATNLYETTQQTKINATDCWTQIANNFGLVAPAWLPVQNAPAGLVNPVFVDNTAAADTVLLVLDRSGSMRKSIREDDVREVCNNGLDDDADGVIDEDAAGDRCVQSRLDHMKAAARAWLDLAEGEDVRVGVLSFQCDTSLDQDFVDVIEDGIGDLSDAVDDLRAGGETSIGDALRAGEEALSGEAEEANKAIYLISDGHHNCGDEEPDQVAEDLQDEGIRVFTVATGDASDDETLVEIAGFTRGEHLDARDGSTLVGAFVQQWARYRNGGVIIPLLAYRTDRNSAVSQEPGQNARRPKDWLGGDPRAPGPPFPRNNVIEFEVEAGTQEVVLVLAGEMDSMSGFGIKASLNGPAGSNPAQFQSEVAHPLLRVVSDSFFLLLEIQNPNPGRWLLNVEGLGGKDAVQTGHLTVISDNPLADLFTRLDRTVVTDPAVPVELGVVPIYHTTLRAVDQLEAILVRPDGSLAPIALRDDSERGGTYSGSIDDMPFQGLYEVRVFLRTGPETFNDPGESIFTESPPNTLPVPLLERARVEHFFVTTGPRTCESGDPQDCNGDGNRNESPTTDSDQDGIPDAHDADSDDDEIPDSDEWQGSPTDLDSDSIPDHLDPDADGDGIRDGHDPSISLGSPTHTLDLSETEMGLCSEIRRLHVFLDTEEPVLGLQLGLEWSPADALEIVGVLGPCDIPAAGVVAVLSRIETADLGSGHAVLGVALDPAFKIPPGTGIRVLELQVRARATAQVGSKVNLCIVDGLGSPRIDTVLSVRRGEESVSVPPQKGCGSLRFTADNQAPILACPGDIVAECAASGGAGEDGARVEFAAIASDNCGDVSVTCTPPSGTLFPVGTTVVLCRAVDPAGNSTYCRFRVQVKPCGGFHRGDPDDSGVLNITDPIFVLNWLFSSGAEPTCLEAADANDDGKVDITDPISLLGYLFGSSSSPAPPGPPAEPCGNDPASSPSHLGCAQYSHCEGGNSP